MSNFSSTIPRAMDEPERGKWRATRSDSVDVKLQTENLKTQIIFGKLLILTMLLMISELKAKNAFLSVNPKRRQKCCPKLFMCTHCLNPLSSKHYDNTCTINLNARIFIVYPMCNVKETHMLLILLFSCILRLNFALYVTLYTAK